MTMDTSLYSLNCDILGHQLIVDWSHALPFMAQFHNVANNTM